MNKKQRFFSDQMKHAKTLLPYEVFSAKIEAGCSEQMMIKELVESYGLEIGVHKAPGVVGAISTIQNIYQKYGYHVLNRTFKALYRNLGGSETNSLSANMLNAVSKLIVTYNNILDEEQFREKLGSVSTKALIRTGKERRPGSFGLAEVMILIYNGKKKAVRISCS